MFISPYLYGYINILPHLLHYVQSNFVVLIDYRIQIILSIHEFKYSCEYDTN